MNHLLKINMIYICPGGMLHDVISALMSHFIVVLGDVLQIFACCVENYIYIFLFWLIGDKDTEISVRKNWVKRRCKEPFCADLNLIAVVCLCIVMCLFYLADLWYYVASFYARITNVCGDWVRRHILLLRPQLDLSPAIKVDFVMMFHVFMVW